MAGADYAREVFVTRLKNIHAMEKQAQSIMPPQVNRLRHYPDLLQRLQAHISETETQIERHSEMLDLVGESSFGARDAFLSAVGSMAAIGHVPAKDEVLKNSLENLAFENYEIAAYISLVTAARTCGESKAVPLLEASLDEELRRVKWVAEHIPAITETFLSLTGSGETAASADCHRGLNAGRSCREKKCKSGLARQ